MSIVNCSVCGVPLDSDAVPEVFRKNDVVRCEWCEDNHCAGGVRRQDGNRRSGPKTKKGLAILVGGGWYLYQKGYNSGEADTMEEP